MLRAKHLICYDGTCGLCHRTVGFFLKQDRKHRFVFTPLQGETAHQFLETHTLKAETFVLIENYRTRPKMFFFGKGALRACWLLGGIWKIAGLFSFLPSFLYNWLYRWVARHRFQWFGKTRTLTPVDTSSKRFLP